MLRPTVKQVFPQDNYILKLIFDNHEIRYFDVKPFIHGSWFDELKDPFYFQSVKANGYTVEWANGQDLCPDELYYNSSPRPL